jgi:hypothetical protein
VSPAPGATGVSRDANVRITFSENLRYVSGKTLKLRNLRTGAFVSVRVTYDPATHRATIDPTYRLMAGTWYLIAVRSDIEDLAGNNTAARSFKFKTRA